jgi:hypothetical protein
MSFFLDLGSTLRVYVGRIWSGSNLNSSFNAFFSKYPDYLLSALVMRRSSLVCCFVESKYLVKFKNVGSRFIGIFKESALVTCCKRVSSDFYADSMKFVFSLILLSLVLNFSLWLLLAEVTLFGVVLRILLILIAVLILSLRHLQSNSITCSITRLK